jgi:hypothetical protein
MEDFLRSMTMKDIGTSLISADQFVTLFNERGNRSSGYSLSF